VIWKGKPLASGKKGSRAHRKSRDLEGETAGECEKGIAGSREGKPLRKRGRKVQSPSRAAGVPHIWAIYGFDMVLIWHQSNWGSGANIKGG